MSKKNKSKIVDINPEDVKVTDVENGEESTEETVVQENKPSFWKENKKSIIGAGIAFIAGAAVAALTLVKIGAGAEPVDMDDFVDDMSNVVNDGVEAVTEDGIKELEI